MKVVINVGIGGFGLSDEAVEECIKLGMKVTTFHNDNFIDENADFWTNHEDDPEAQKYFGKYSIIYKWEKKIRTNPIVIEVVKRLGEKANGHFSMLKIVDIPFDTMEGWEITEDEVGIEKIEEIHRTWQ